MERILYSDLLNPVDATSTQIHEEQVREDIHITEADVRAVIKSLKSGKAPSKNDESNEHVLQGWAIISHDGPDLEKLLKSRVTR